MVSETRRVLASALPPVLSLERTRLDVASDAREVGVLRIIMDTATGRRGIVQGRLIGSWVSELRTTWKRANLSQDKRTCIIDLDDVTFIDKSGAWLRAMSKKGARLIAEGQYVKPVLEQLKSLCMPRTARAEDQ
jgi:hypothetical protein